MRKNHYLSNMQKLLYIVKELHIRGYEKLRIIPAKSPSGMSWRCSFITDNPSQNQEIIASNWIHEDFNLEEEIEYTIEELTDKFESEYSDFLHLCRGRNSEYAIWYRGMLNKLGDEELPYALADYFRATDHWRTTEGQEIKILPDEKWIKRSIPTQKTV